MDRQLKRRAFERFKYKVPAKIFTSHHNGYKSKTVHFYSIACLNNYSRCGAYFETETSIPPGTSVTIKIAGFTGTDECEKEEGYKANVIWCKRISGSHNKLFGIGLMYDKLGNNCIFGF